ncbi:MAG: hypothetical protein H6696_02960 [Deferribacteres bacterium]|nr:hypothetical protein [candidate division KSB1 bacterium]MCB9500875.1 hypothetical protein [Deferribacteres bacterium]
MEQSFALVENLLLKKQQRFTDFEASRITGVAIDQVKDALEKLLEKYVCRMQVTENGDLIYDFGPKPRRRGEKTAAEILQAIGDWLWKVFTVLFKIWLTVTLLVYFVIFVILIILLIVASSSQRDSKSRGSSSIRFSGGGGIPIFDILWSIFRWRTITGGIVRRNDRRGYHYNAYEPHQAVLKKDKKNLVASVHDFVFGPPRVDIDPLQNEREVAAFLETNKGILVSADLEALAGLNCAQAEYALTDYLIRFEGDVDVSENGAVYGKFERILRGVEDTDGEIIYYWNEYEPEYHTTGNTPQRNFFIALMNGVNLLVSYSVMRGNFDMLSDADFNGLAGAFVQIILDHQLLFGGIPFVFSILFFLVPLVRWLKIRRLRQQRHKNNIRKRLYKVIFSNAGTPQSAENIVAKVNHSGVEETLADKTISTFMDELVLDLNGETVISEDAKIQYHFPRISLEQKEAVALRSRSKMNRDLGDVVFDTDK